MRKNSLNQKEERSELEMLKLRKEKHARDEKLI